MKKILFTAVSALAMGAAFAADSTQFGVLKVPSTAKQTIVSVPWLESGTGNQAVTVSNLVLTAGLQDGDTLKLFENGAYTQGWQLKNGAWEPGTVTTGDDVKSQSGNDQTTIARGKAIMLTRTANPITGGFYIMGKPATAGVKTVLGAGYSLVAPPSTTAVDLNNSAVITWANLADDDKILLPSEDGKTTATYAYVTPTAGGNKAWCRWAGKGKKDGGYVTTGVTIPMGVGAWFLNGGKGAGEKSFTFGKLAAD